MKIHANKSFREKWDPELAMYYPAQVPSGLALEASNLMFLGECIFMNCNEEFKSHATHYLAKSDSMTGVEYSLNKRHIFDYLEPEQAILEYSLGVFGQFKELVYSKAVQLGMQSPIGFLWATPNDDVIQEYSRPDPIMTFFRLIPKDPAVVISSIENNQTERILIITFDHKIE